MAATEEDVAKSRAKVDDLRAELRDAQRDAASGNDAASAELRQNRLDAEAERLQAQIAAVRGPSAAPAAPAATEAKSPAASTPPAKPSTPPDSNDSKE